MLFEPSFKLYPEQTQTCTRISSLLRHFTHPYSSVLISHPHPSVLILIPQEDSSLSFITRSYLSVLILIFEYSSLSLSTHPYPLILILILHYSSLFFTTHPHALELILILQYSSFSFSTHPYPSVLILILQKSSLSFSTHPHPIIYSSHYSYQLILILSSIFPLIHSFRIIHLCSPNLSYFPYLLILTPF